MTGRDEAGDEMSAGHPLTPEPLDTPLSTWRGLADATPGGGWVFAVTGGDRQYGDRHAVAFDPAANVLYSATMDGHDRLTHVTVTVSGDDIEAARFIDIQRAARELRAFIAQHGVPWRTSSAVPSAEEIADLVERRGWGRNELAAHYRRPVRTVDRWMRDARAAFPDRMPAPTRGPSARKTQDRDAGGEPIRYRNEWPNETPEPIARDHRGKSPTNRKADR
ncbi:hypothetical protein F6B41_25465 [Microbacterium lushaniae]|nr:hypothetical protein F6B41_25465 [Microbacterium lushaniae]